MTFLTKPVILLTLSLLWIGAVGARWWAFFPRLPLDSAGDPGTQAILDQARASYSVHHAVAAVAVPVGLSLISWLSRRRTKRA